MARETGTFGGVHRPLGPDGRGRSVAQARRRAHFDHEPAASGCGAVLLTILALALALLIGILG